MFSPGSKAIPSLSCSPHPPGLSVVTGLPGTLDTDGTPQLLERVVDCVSIPGLATLPP